MAVAASEVLQRREPSGADEGRVYLVPELGHDADVRQRAAAFIGAVATEAWQPPEAAAEALTVRPLESLHDAVQAAAEGDQTAYKMIETNVRTEVIERTIKSGHVMEVDLYVDEAGTIQQHGQTLDSVQANSLRFAADSWQMRERVEAETRNAFRIKHYHETGILQDYYFVVFSRAADNMTEAEMSDAGFFTDTMSCAVQVTSAYGKRLRTESAFVAGRKRADMPRHDEATIRAVLKRLGVEGAGMSAADLLDSPLLIHKSLLPDGALNLVELYDDCAGGTFFGEAKPKQEYPAYRRQCAEREAGFKPVIDRIISRLVAEAPSITSRIMATERLDKLAGAHMVEWAITDKTINSDVFGTTAAAHIELARWHQELGNVDQARAELRVAIMTDRSASCPSGRKRSSSKDTGTSEGDSSSGGSDELGDCEFVSKECPLCHKKNVKTLVKKIGGVKQINGDCGCSKTVVAE